MSASLKKCFGEIRRRVRESPSLIQRLATGQKSAGSRAVPAKSARNDELVGGRVDFGETFEKDGKLYQTVNFQVNSNAQDSKLRALAKKNGSHKQYAQAAILISEPEVPEERVDGKGKKVKLTKAEIVQEKKKKREEVVFNAFDKMQNQL